jgi:L,D-transpeptidase ErfK/SrfK
MSPVDVLTASDAPPGKVVAAPAAPTPADLARRARRRRLLRVFLFALLGLGVAAAAAAGFVASRGGFYAPLETLPAQAASKLEIKPEGVYVVVDTHANRLRVYKDGQLLREAICSTGSGTVLTDPRNGKTWVFDTPYGERKVQRKTRDPIWYKPDWAFIEEGKLPPRNPADRVDDISLGKYGLYMGDGYIIHGTIFQSLLGQRLTHGCIRLGDADLEYVFNTVPLGARVFLY